MHIVLKIFAGAMIVGAAFIAIALLTYQKCSPYQAEREAQKYVKAALKAPSTANFPSAKVTIEPASNTRLITGFVDAQNGFGAMIRSGYSVRLSCDDKYDAWTFEDFRFN